jgi:hypothetical protein
MVTPETTGPGRRENRLFDLHASDLFALDRVDDPLQRFDQTAGLQVKRNLAQTATIID